MVDTSRRGFFGLMAAAPAAAKSVSRQLADIGSEISKKLEYGGSMYEGEAIKSSSGWGEKDYATDKKSVGESEMLRGRKLLAWLDKHGGVPEHRKAEWARDAARRTRHGVVTSDVAVLKSINVSTQRVMSMKTLVRDAEIDFRAALVVREDETSWHDKINKRLKKFRINLY